MLRDETEEGAHFVVCDVGVLMVREAVAGDEGDGDGMRCL